MRPVDGIDTHALLKSAAAAIYHAKNAGRNNHQFLKQSMNDEAVEWQLVELRVFAVFLAFQRQFVAPVDGVGVKG